jgi:hypothetical protein
LLRNIVDLLGKWYEVFSILGKAERTPDRFVALSLAIRAATQKHRLLGLPKTPKFHIIESHAEELEEEMPLPLYEVKEEFVEQNHQLGHKEEENVKRISNLEQRAKSKAEKIWISLNSNVQKQIHNVNKPTRGQYNTKKMQEVTPSPPRRLGNFLVLEDEDEMYDFEGEGDCLVTTNQFLGRILSRRVLQRRCANVMMMDPMMGP